jgi:UDP-glucuronate 4-epimerase
MCSGNLMNILVTGASGLIGMALREQLSGGSDNVVATDATNYGRDDSQLTVARLEDRSAMEKLIQEGAISHIAHCGAISGPMMARDNPLIIVESNILATATLLDIARRAGVKRFVFCSSVSVYGDVGPGIVTEDTPLRPTSIYGASKVAGEQLVRGFAIEGGFEGVSLRLARIYGPYRRGDCYLGTMIRDARAGKRTIIPCDPNFPYHYIYVDDVVDAILLALTAPKLPQYEYNVGPEEVLTMPEVVARARKAIPGISVSLVPGADQISDHQERFAISKIAADLKWKPRWDLATGIAHYSKRMPAAFANGQFE